MSDQPATDLWNEINSLKAELHKDIFPAMRIAQASFTELVKQANHVAGQLDNAVAKLLMPVVEETEAAGTGVTGRRRRSTNLEAPSVGGEAPVKAAPARQVREMSGELVTPGSGKRGCSNCKRTGHRAASCPN